jgi:hypothetical protein
MPSPSEPRPAAPGSAVPSPPVPRAPAGGAPSDGAASAPRGDGGGGRDAVPGPPSARRPPQSGARPEAPGGRAERSEPAGRLAEGAGRASGAPPRVRPGVGRPAWPPAPPRAANPLLTGLCYTDGARAGGWGLGGRGRAPTGRGTLGGVESARAARPAAGDVGTPPARAFRDHPTPAAPLRAAQGYDTRPHRRDARTVRTARPPARTTPGAPGKGALPAVGAARPCAGFLAGVVLLCSGDGADGGQAPHGWPSAVRHLVRPTSATCVRRLRRGARAAPEGVPTAPRTAATARGQAGAPTLRHGHRNPKTGPRRARSGPCR